MDLSNPAWLSDLLGRILGGYVPERAVLRLAPSVREGTAETLRRRVLEHVDAELRRSGLIYGSPKLPSRVTQGTRLDRNEALFLAVLSGETLLALDVARIMEVPFDRFRAEAELTMFFAAAAGREDLAEQIEAHALALPDPSLRTFDRLQVRVAAALLRRQALATGETIFDLPIHNGVVFGEARMVARLAYQWHLRGRFSPKAARRLYAAADRERAALLQALLALALSYHPLSDAERRIVRRELSKLRLPRRLHREVRSSLAVPLAPEELAARIKSRPLRRFILEQIHLSGVVLGSVDEMDRQFVENLGALFGIEEDYVRAIEAQIADYFYDPTDILDAFEVRAAGQSVSENLIDRIAREIEENLDKVVLEAKETGDLLQLLARAARGERLRAEERTRVREQLIDLAKVVPSLAIISAPGGMILFAALLKVLPFSLLPSSFQRRETPTRRRRPRRAPLASRPSSRR